MGYIIRLILVLIVVNFVVKLLFRLFFGWKMKNMRNNSYGQRQKEQRQRYQHNSKKSSTPETQEDRILDFQKKSFEKTDAEDADFIEIK